MIARRTVLCLGLSQFICWGVSYYSIGVFGDLIAADRGWSRSLVFGGFSVALVVMGLTSPFVGRLIDRFGGRPIMTAGSVLCAIGCVGLSLASTVGVYYAAWVCLGLAMRAILYNAAFATLARIGGPAARRPMAQITLFGGLASTFFWPLGHTLVVLAGWRGALLIYGAIALATIPLHLALPSGRSGADASPDKDLAGPARPYRQGRIVPAAFLFATVTTLAVGLSAAMSAHMIGLLEELGLATALAVSVASLRGVGQSLARLAEVLFGRRIHPADLNLAATMVLPVCFLVGLIGAGYPLAAAAFAFFYGAANGILTITAGTLPLILFETRSYGGFVGKLLVPGFLLSALAPLGFAAIIDSAGAGLAMALATTLALIMLGAAIALKWLVARGDVWRERKGKVDATAGR